MLKPAAVTRKLKDFLPNVQNPRKEEHQLLLETPPPESRGEKIITFR